MFGGAVYVGYIIKTVGHVALDIEDSFSNAAEIMVP